MGMKPEFLSKFKRILEELGSNLRNKIKKLQRVPDFGSDIDSLEEEADETEEFGNRMAVASEYRGQLANVDSALEKIKEKKYGICDNCGKEIEKEVLELVPESSLCKSCKKKSR